MNKKKMICIVCPVGCQIEVIKDDNSDKVSVTGNQCKRGVEYGIKELTNPTRWLTTTVKFKNSSLKRLPVRTDLPIPKGMIAKCMKEINSIEAHAPIKAGCILIENILNTGVNVISTRSVG